MFVRVRLFAILRERAGSDHVEVELPDPATVQDAIRAIAELPGLAGLHGGSARMAVNRAYAALDTQLGPDDELALIPPVSGGEDPAEFRRRDPHREAQVTRTALVHEPLVQFVQRAHAGAVVTFAGYPRDIAKLDYEAYPEMALEQIWTILGECRHTHGLCAAAAAHRIGVVPAPEASVLVAASAPHRAEAFAGARAILDEIKAQAAIWKVEVDAAGGRHRPAGALPG